MQQANKELRKKIEKSGVHYWQIADKLEVSSSTLCIWFRKELPKEKKELILAAVEDLQKGES